jgi:WD40 repeat protein
LHSVRQLSLEREIQFHCGLDCVHGVTFSDDGSILAAGFSEGKVALWDFWGEKFMVEIKTPNSGICIDQVRLLFFAPIFSKILNFFFHFYPYFIFYYFFHNFVFIH